MAFNNGQINKKYKGIAWIFFFLSTIALIAAVALHWPWLTLILPFVTTSFVMGMDII